MIRNLLFDFGDVFINLDKTIVLEKMASFGLSEITPALSDLMNNYEMGLLTSEKFITEIQNHFPKAEVNEITSAWNSIILDFPEYRLEFLEKLKVTGKYRLFLLSNTNDLHIARVKEVMGLEKWQRFKKCFEQFYLSQQIHLRKPSAAIYKYVLEENDLTAQETLFIDDTEENIAAASKLNIATWHLKVGAEDIINLKQKL